MKINLSHGAGGKATRQLILNTILPKLKNPVLEKLCDSGVFKIQDIELAFTTDSYVVNPIFFTGGDIGKLSVTGTVNDLVVSGALPLYISYSIIAEEGLDLDVLDRITESVNKTSQEAKVKIITGDIKVVGKGQADKLFINTAGIGRVLNGVKLSQDDIKVGDKIIINGTIGEHGIAILASRGELDLEAKVKSDCANLSDLIIPLLREKLNIRFMRDPTRGGIASVLNEIVEGNNFGIALDEKKLPILETTKAACELLGFDPLHLANEGKVIIIADGEASGEIVKIMRRHPLGKKTEIIGEVIELPRGKVYMKTIAGGERIVDMPTGELLPRIC